MNVIILSATSDIATEMCTKWTEKNWKVVGTYCNQNKNYELLTTQKMRLVYCDFSNSKIVEKAAEDLKNTSAEWDYIIFATGTLSPIRSFEKVDFDQWSKSIDINFTNQMRMLHALLPFRNSRSSSPPGVLFFAGGGTNNATLNYSAYTLSKIALIKACELLDAECEQVKFSILGPGWVKTRIHEETLKAGPDSAGESFDRVKQRLASGEFISISTVIESVEWIMSQPKEVVGGRNFSTAFDKWGSNDLVQALKKEPNMYKLRRFGNSILT